MADEDQAPQGSEFREKLEGALSENQQLKLDNALLRAGVDLDTPMGKMFAQAASTRSEFDADALKEEWAELTGGQAAPSAQPATTPEPGLDPTLAAIQAQQTPSVPGVSPEAMESLELSQQAADAEVAGTPQEQMTAPEAATAALMEVKAENGDAVMQNAAFFGTLLSRAAAGDPTALWTQEAWDDRLRDVGEIA